MRGTHLELNVFEVVQPIGKFYIGVMDSKDIVELSSTNMGEITSQDKNDIYQRRLDEKRLPLLKKYVNYSRASFPNGIILNSKECLEYCDGKLRIPRKKDVFFIIDGQHRIEALKHYNKENKFQICVIIFNKLNIDMQTELFVTVNNEQKKVNPNVRLNLKGNEKVDSPEKVVRNIVIAFNDDEESPFYNMIKLDDSKDDDKIISLHSFATPIIEYIYSSKDYYDIKEKLMEKNNDRATLKNFYERKKQRIFWDLYVEKEESLIYSILYNYFTVIKDLLPNDWGDDESLLCKTTGYNAIMLLFKDIYNALFPDFSYKSIYNQLKNIKKMNGKFTLENVGLGKAATVRLYNLFLTTINDKNDKKYNFDLISLFDETED